MSFNHRFGWSTVLMPYLVVIFYGFFYKEEPSQPSFPSVAEPQAAGAVPTSSADWWEVLFPCSGSMKSREVLFSGMQRCSETSLTSIARHVMDMCTALSLGGSKSPPKLTINPSGRHHIGNRKLGKRGKVSQHGEIWVLHLCCSSPNYLEVFLQCSSLTPATSAAEASCSSWGR